MNDPDHIVRTLEAIVGAEQQVNTSLLWLMIGQGALTIAIGMLLWRIYRS